VSSGKAMGDRRCKCRGFDMLINWMCGGTGRRGRIRRPRNPKAMQLAVVWDKEWGSSASSEVGLVPYPASQLSDGSLELPAAGLCQPT
jgi:hypothetical protein